MERKLHCLMLHDGGDCDADDSNESDDDDDDNDDNAECALQLICTRVTD